MFDILDFLGIIEYKLIFFFLRNVPKIQSQKKNEFYIATDINPNYIHFRQNKHKHMFANKSLIFKQ